MLLVTSVMPTRPRAAGERFDVRVNLATKPSSFS